jgi:hypothetical protein
MRRILLGCGMAAVLIVTVLAPPPAIASRLPTLTPTGGYGSWTVIDAAPSPLDGSPNFTAQLNADNAVFATRGRPQKPILAFFCDHDGLALNIQWPANIDISRGQFSETLLWKVDDGRLSKSELGYNKTMLIQVGRPANVLAHLWAGGKVLAVRVPDHFGGQDATFHIEGLDLIVAHIDKTGCGPPRKSN